MCFRSRGKKRAFTFIWVSRSDTRRCRRYYVASFFTGVKDSINIILTTPRCRLCVEERNAIKTPGNSMAKGGWGSIFIHLWCFGVSRAASVKVVEQEDAPELGEKCPSWSLVSERNDRGSTAQEFVVTRFPPEKLRRRFSCRQSVWQCISLLFLRSITAHVGIEKCVNRIRNSPSAATKRFFFFREKSTVGNRIE